MAKRKRLTPPDPTRISPELETKSRNPLGPAPARTIAPIANVARETAAQAALEEVTDTLNRARDEGRMIIPVRLTHLSLNYLVRDRLPVMDDEMTSLIESLRARGQQTPIEVTPLEGGRYGVISGWRRCKALDHLRRETGEERFATVLAVVRQPEHASDAYLAMVEENEIRAGLSYYERARIVALTVKRSVYPTQKKALQALFANASRTKRSKIKSFLRVVSALDGALRFPRDLGERTGLQLAKMLGESPDLGEELAQELAAKPPQSAEEELAVIQQALSREKQALNPRLETHEDDEIAPGVTMKTGRGGTVTLGGPAWNEGMRDRLIAWLRADLARPGDGA